MRTEILLVTPEMAKEFLKRNIGNRPCYQKTVLDYARQMKDGEWRLTGQGISISKNGLILDGQHRLEAVIKANTPIEFLVITGVDDDTFANYDVGKNRSFSDVFYIEGIKSYTRMSSIITSYHRRSNGVALAESTKKLSKKNAIDLYYKHASLFTEILKESERYYNSGLMTISFMGGFIAYLIIDKKHLPDKVFSFFEQLTSGRDVENNTILLFRDILIKDLAGRYKMSPKMKESLLATTWNRYVQGVELKVLKYYTDKEIEEII